MPMQPSPIVDTSRPLFPSARFFIVDTSGEIADSRPFPCHPPMFVGTGRRDDQLLPRKLVATLQVFSNQAAHHGTFDVERPCMRTFVHVIPAIRGFVSAVRVPDRSGLAAARVAIHHLHGCEPVAGEREQARAVSAVNLSVCAGFFEPCEPPRTDKPFAITLSGR